MNLKIGNSYKLRNGLKTPPLKKEKNGTNYVFVADVKEPEHKEKSKMCWLKNGRYLSSNINYRYDIIEEC